MFIFNFIPILENEQVGLYGCILQRMNENSLMYLENSKTYFYEIKQHGLQQMYNGWPYRLIAISSRQPLNLNVNREQLYNGASTPQLLFVETLGNILSDSIDIGCCLVKFGNVAPQKVTAVLIHHYENSHYSDWIIFDHYDIFLIRSKSLPI